MKEVCARTRPHQRAVPLRRILVLLGAAALGLVVTATAASAAGAITVTPHTDLVDGQVVTVEGTGWQPFATVAFCQAVPVDAPDPGDCASGGFTLRSADDAGNFSTTTIVSRVIHVPSLGHEVDCADPSDPCVIGAADFGNLAGTVTLAPLEFAPGAVVIVPGAATVAEGSSGTTTLDVPVRLSFPADVTVTADWTTATAPGAPVGAADPASDFTADSGTVTFAAGETEQVISVSVNGDPLVEPDEFVVIGLSNPTNAELGGFWGLGFGVIANDDDAVVLPGGASVAEGDAGTSELLLPVTLSNPSSVAVTVQWTTATAPGAPDAVADPGTDFTPSSGTVTFAPGETDQVVSIDIIGDTLDEPDEWLVVGFHHPTNAQLGGFWGLGFGVITDDD